MTKESKTIDWEKWEKLIKTNKIAIDRSKNSPHPRFPNRIYPVDYGYIKNTKGSDNEEVDVFVGTNNEGLVGVIFTIDKIKNDSEIKLLWNRSKEEINAVLKFVNFGAQSGELIMRNKD